MTPFDITAIDWQKMQGLIPAIIQDANNGQVLMLGYMNQTALQQTLESKRVTFFSRSRNALWVKGETSGNYLMFVNIVLDCDHDSLLITANPAGPTCHEGTASCFNSTTSLPWHVLTDLETTIAQRQRDLPQNSYTTELFKSGLARIAQKVGEEGIETVIAALTADQQTLSQEIADLLYHLLVLMRTREVSLADVTAVLAQRRG